jgi:hypothetical protein
VYCSMVGGEVSGTTQPVISLLQLARFESLAASLHCILSSLFARWPLLRLPACFFSAFLIRYMIMAHACAHRHVQPSVLGMQHFVLGAHWPTCSPACSPARPSADGRGGDEAAEDDWEHLPAHGMMPPRPWEVSSHPLPLLGSSLALACLPCCPLPCRMLTAAGCVVVALTRNKAPAGCPTHTCCYLLLLSPLCCACMLLT